MGYNDSFENCKGFCDKETKILNVNSAIKKREILTAG